MAIWTDIGRFFSPATCTTALPQHGAPGFTIPVKASVRRDDLFVEKRVEGEKINLSVSHPDGKIENLGDVYTDRHGEATAHFTPQTPGEYRIFCTSEKNATHDESVLNVADGDKPVVVLDADDFLARWGWEETLNLLKLTDSVGAPYRLAAITTNEHLKTRLEKAGAAVPVILNDYRDSPFGAAGDGFAETLLEKLKRLKFENGLPVVAVLTRHFPNTRGFAAAGIETIVPHSSALPLELHATVYWDYLLSQFRKDAALREKLGFGEYYWQGMTQGALLYGNAIDFFIDNEAAGREFTRLLNGAQTFLHLSSYLMYSDRFGKSVFWKLLQSLDQGKAVRMIVDRFTQVPFPSDRGFTWLDPNWVQALAAAGAEAVFHHVFHPESEQRPPRGPRERRHRKNLIVDYADADTPRQVVAYGGGRLISSISYENLKIEAAEFWKILGIGWGSYHDLSFTVKGPVAGEINRRFLRDFAEYGGNLGNSPDELENAPAPPQKENLALRYVVHDSHMEQNCHDVLMAMLRRPDSDGVVFANSFTPSENLADAMITAARNGKKVRWITGKFWGYHGRNKRLIPRLMAAGVEVVVVPYQWHGKVYVNNRWIACGNQNQDGLSQRDSEDLVMLPRDGNAAAEDLLLKLAILQSDGIRLNDCFKPGADPKTIMEFVDALPHPDKANVKDFEEKSPLAALARLVWFLLTAPLRKSL